MQIEFELVTYDVLLDKFDLDETIHHLKISDEDAQTYELLKSSDLNLYNWFRESEPFIKYVHEKIYPESKHTKIAISEINDTTYRRFYFFKVTSSDSHYEYFKKLFDIFEESDWQDREEIGLEILDHLAIKRQELIIDLSEYETVKNETDRS
jgi:succinate dehydrogenase flavin-adding protein (antitoxin of CptAB toxin-antitoxin module)